MTKFSMHSMNQNTTDAMTAPANRPAFRMSCTNGTFCAASMTIILGSAILAESILFALALVLGLLLAVLSLLVLVSVRISPPRSANRRYILASLRPPHRTRGSGNGFAAARAQQSRFYFSYFES